MKTYSFKVVLERDGDAWHVYCPALEHLGGATWGKNQEEALKHINEVVQMKCAMAFFYAHNLDHINVTVTRMAGE